MLVGKHDPNPDEPIIARYLDGSKLELFCRTFIGSASIYEVYDAFSKSNAIRYAIKVIHHEIPRIDDDREQAYRKFLRGSKHGLLLEHKNIVRTYAVGHPEDQTQDFKRPFVVCEFLSGKSLAALIQTNKPSLSEMLEIASVACDALDYAFAKRGILHGNLKPSNIFLETIDGKTVVKIGDFDGADSHFGSLVMSRSCDGHNRDKYSLAYKSPEWALGKKVTASSDIYSLGCILYECLSGRPPFVGDTTVHALELHVKEQPEPLSANVAPVNIAAMIMKALEKDPEKRCQSAAEMQSAIQAAQASL
jgi:serine/threonine-protein kinase